MTYKATEEEREAFEKISADDAIAHAVVSVYETAYKAGYREGMAKGTAFGRSAMAIWWVPGVIVITGMLSGLAGIALAGAMGWGVQ